MNKIYLQGVAAHAEGAERAANPHHRPAARRAWDNGWCDAKFNHDAMPLPLTAVFCALAGILLAVCINLFKLGNP